MTLAMARAVGKGWHLGSVMVPFGPRSRRHVEIAGPGSRFGPQAQRGTAGHPGHASVRLRGSGAGFAGTGRAIAVQSAPTTGPARAGPVFARGPSSCPRMGGRRRGIAARAVWGARRADEPEAPRRGGPDSSGHRPPPGACRSWPPARLGTGRDGAARGGFMFFRRVLENA